MKLQSALFISLMIPLCILSTACSKATTTYTTKVDGSAESSVNAKATEERNSRCKEVELVLQSPGVDKLKAGFDLLVAEMSAEEKQSLIEGARVWRRATPSAAFTDDEIKNRISGGVETLNQIGVRMVLQGLTRFAPKMETRTGLMYSHTINFPDPTSACTSKSTNRECYNGLPGFGLGFGDSFADSGFTVVGQLYTDANANSYTVTMKYSAAASKYGVDVVRAKDTKALKADDCESSQLIAALRTLPKPQTTLRECEWGACKNIPKD